MILNNQLEISELDIVIYKNSTYISMYKDTTKNSNMNPTPHSPQPYIH